jgi:ElaB/YqjD/DUF883 family membrane-anchored ribosome-binding protein
MGGRTDDLTGSATLPEDERDDEIIDGEVVAPRSDADADIGATRAQIEQTRAEMGETLGAIKERLSPQHLAQQAKETLREATVGKAQEAAAVSIEKARGTGTMIMETIRENPVPAVLTGIGMTWLYLSARSTNGRERFYDSSRAAGQYGEYGTAPATESSGDRPFGRAPEQIQAVVDEAKHKAEPAMSDARQKAGQITGQVKEQVGMLREQAYDQAQRVAARYDRMLQHNPLALGAIALTLGLAIGLLLPETRQENRLMGEAKERLVESAQQTAQEVAQKVQSVAKEAVEAAKEEASTRV